MPFRLKKHPTTVPVRPAPAQQELKIRLVGLEPTTYGLEDRCSVRLSYRRWYSIFQIILLQISTPTRTRTRAFASGGQRSIL
jgi:hypothetical protein